MFLQLVSWGVGGKIEKLWKGTTGRTGVTMVICLPLIALPMMVKYFKINIRYEVGDLQVFWNKSMRMGYCTWDIGDGSKPSLHILDLMMWLVGVWKDLG